VYAAAARIAAGQQPTQANSPNATTEPIGSSIAIQHCLEDSRSKSLPSTVNDGNRKLGRHWREGEDIMRHSFIPTFFS
jgi:hypothetical protein